MAQVEWNGFAQESKDELEYLKLNAQVGLATTKDTVNQFRRLNMTEENKQKLEQTKQNVIEARKRRDEFAYAHQDSVGDTGDKILAGLVEGISSPVELGLGMAVGALLAPVVGVGAIAGATVFGAGILVDILIEEAKARYYEDRELTNEEILNMAAGEILLGGAAAAGKHIYTNGVSGTMNNLTNSFYKATNRAGDIKVDPYKTITQVDNIGISDVAKQQQLQTDFGIKSKDYYSIKPEQIMKLNTKVNKVYDTLNGLSEVEGLIPFQKEDMAHNSLLTRTLKPYGDLEGPLTFMTSETKEANKELFQQLKAETGYDINKTPVQNAISMRKKENDLVKDFLHNIDDTVENYYAENPTGKTNTGKHTVNDRQIREAFNIIDNETKAQIGYVQSEYLNILNQDRVNPVSFKQFINEVNPDDKSIAKTLILDVNNGSTKLDTEFNSGKFFQTVNADSMLLDEMQMGVNPYEFNDFDKFNRKFGMLFDDEEVIKYDGDTIVALSKANDIDKHTLKMALKENPERYVDIVESINKVLDDGNLNKADKEMIEEMFGTTYKKISNAVKRDADYWRAEFDRMKTEVPNYKVNPYWKREVQNKLNKRKRELALESTRINKNINKQEMIHEFEQYFEGGLVNESNKSTVTLSKTKEVDFENEIMPYFDDGIFKLNEGQDPVRVFAEFVSDLKLTRRKAKYVDKYKTIGELRDYFNENKMGEFFATGHNEKYLKNNAQNIRDIVDYQARNIGMFNVQGSVSPYYLPSKFKYDLPKIYSQMKGEVIQDSKAKFLNNTVGSMADTFFKNTQLGWEKPAVNPALNITSKVRSGINRYTLALTGAVELGPMNIGTALNRGQMYFGVGHVFNNGKFYVDKMLRDARRIGDSSIGEFTIGYMNKQMNIGKYGLDLTKTQKFFNGVDTVIYSLQEISDKQLRNLGEIISTSELYKLSTFEKVENQLKSLLKMNNIDETNFADFVKFTKEHIDSNGKYIDIYKLSQLSELGNEYAKALRNVHYQLTDYIGNVKHSSKFNQVYRNEVSRWAELFRSTTRVMNADLINRMLYYTNENGLARCRLNPYNWSEPGMLIKSAKGSIYGLSVLTLGGLPGYFIYELLYSNRTMDQRLAVCETKLEEIADLFNDPGFGKTAMFMLENAHLTSDDFLGTSNVPLDTIKKCKRIYDLFTDEEKNLYGITENKEGWKAVFKLLAPMFISRVGYNNLSAVYKYNTQGDLLSIEKVYGFDKEQQDFYETKVVKYNAKDIDTMLKEDRAMIKAQSSYLNNDTEYFDTLSKQEKEQARIIWDNHPEVQEQGIEDYKSSYGYIKANVSNDDELQEGFKVMYNVDISKDLEQPKPKEEPKPNIEIVAREEIKSKLNDDQIRRLHKLVSSQKEKGYRNDIVINEKDIEDYIKYIVEPKSRNRIHEVYYNLSNYYKL